MPKATDNLTTSRRSALRGLGLTSIAAGLAVPALARTKPDDADADAELIRACNEIVAAETRINALYKVRRTVEDEENTEPELAALYRKQSELVDLIDRAPPTTLTGIRAMARASIAIAPLDRDGETEFEGGDAELTVVKLLAGSAVV